LYESLHLSSRTIDHAGKAAWNEARSTQYGHIILFQRAVMH